MLHRRVSYTAPSIVPFSSTHTFPRPNVTADLFFPFSFIFVFPSASARTSSAFLCSSIFVFSFTVPFQCVPFHFRHVTHIFASSVFPRPTSLRNCSSPLTIHFRLRLFLQSLYEPLPSLCAPSSSCFHSPFLSNVFFFISYSSLSLSYIRVSSS